jgi:hypothetical protein
MDNPNSSFSFSLPLLYLSPKQPAMLIPLYR